MVSVHVYKFGVVLVLSLGSIHGSQDISNSALSTPTITSTNNPKTTTTKITKLDNAQEFTTTSSSKTTKSLTTYELAPKIQNQNQNAAESNAKEEIQTDLLADGSENSAKTVELTTESLTEINARKQDVALVNGRVPSKPGRLVKCRCGAKEVLTKSGCQIYTKDTYIFGEDDSFQPVKVAVSSLDVVVHEPKCKKQDGHREMSVGGNQFYLRQRGDIVLKGDVGDMEGLRVNNYCVSHYMDEEGRVSWSMKRACIPPPSVPRCCPPGEAMNENGKCEQASTPNLLVPPVAADIFKDAVPWPAMKNHINTITCTKDPVKSLPLSPQESYLLNVPTGMVHIWNPNIDYVGRIYTYPNDFCVDGVKTHWGEVEYSVKLCYTDPLEEHQKACDGNTCIRKCCREGEVMDTSLYRCITNPNTSVTYQPPFSAEHVISYKTVVGYPLCLGRTVHGNVSIDAHGQLSIDNRVFPPRLYCSDLFTNGKGEMETAALVCMTTTTTWSKVRSLVFPMCTGASILFLILTVACYCLLPSLLQRGGWCHLFHATSLMFAYATSFAQNYGGSWNDRTCISVALIMQFWFLCTFFWLTVLCFDAWRRIRSLNTKQPSPDTPLGRYMLFAYGGPLVISVVTILMQFLAPDHVAGLIKPHLAVSRCWFPDTKELLSYFYGPSAVLFALNILLNALTYAHYRNLQRRSPGLKQLGHQEGSEVTQALSNDLTQYSLNAVADFKQQFCLLVLMSTCWVFEILSWKIPPPEIWALTDILNSLQGFFIFVFFVANDRKRSCLRSKFPRAFVAAKHLSSLLCCRKGEKGGGLSPSSSTSSIFQDSSPPSPNLKSGLC